MSMKAQNISAKNTTLFPFASKTQNKRAFNYKINQKNQIKNVTILLRARVYLFGEIRAMRNTNTKGFDVRIWTELGTKLTQSASELGVRHIVAAVSEHFEDRSATEVVPMALHAAFVKKTSKTAASVATVEGGRCSGGVCVVVGGDDCHSGCCACMSVNGRRNV